MKKSAEYPIRIVDLPHSADPGQIDLSLLIRSATAAPSEDTPAVTWRIRNTLHQRRRRRSRGLRFALASTIIFMAGGIAGAVVPPLLRSRMLALLFSHTAPGATAPTGQSARRSSRPQPIATEPATVATVASGSAATPVEPHMVTSTPAPFPSTSVTSGGTAKVQAARSKVAATNFTTHPTLEPGARPVSAGPLPPLGPPSATAPTMPAPGAAAAVPTSAGPSAEHELITAALRKLRTSHEPEAALDALDDYLRRFPSGQFAPEAARLRAEALLLLGHKATLRDELDLSLPKETPASDERLVLRGELRAATGRWSAALVDFDAVVRAQTMVAGSGAVATDRRTRERLERALWGRASARSHVGDDVGARADLRAYVRRFPDGRFAREANRLLEEPR